MANNLEYEADSPLSCSVEEGELNSGRSRPGSIRENASECSTQTDEYEQRETTMRVEVANESTSEQQITRPANTKGDRSHHQREIDKTKCNRRKTKFRVLPY